MNIFEPGQVFEEEGISVEPQASVLKQQSQSKYIWMQLIAFGEFYGI